MANEITQKVVLQLVDQMSGKVQEAVDKSKGALDNFASHAKDVGQQMMSFGATAAAAGASIGGGLGVAVKQFADLEQSMALLKSTMTGKGGLSANFQAISDLSVKLGNQLPGNTEDFAKMINKLLQLGVSEQDVLGGVGEAAANLAVVMKIPYEEAAKAAAKLKQATGTSNEDMLKFMDTMQRTGHQGVAVGEMMEAFAHAAGGLKSFGLQGEETTRTMSALFAILIKTGLSGQTAGTNLTTMFNSLSNFEFTKLADQPKLMAIASEQLRNLGITLDFFDNETKKFKGVDNMVLQFEKLKNLDLESRSQIMRGIFGGGTDQQIASILTTGGVQQLDEMRNKMADQADLQTRSAIQLTTLTSKWEAAMGTFQNMLAKIGEQLAPTLGKFVDWFGEVSAKLQGWIENNKTFATVVLEVLGGLAAALTVVGAGGLAAGGIALTLGTIASGLSAIAAAGPAFLAFIANPAVATVLGLAGAAVVGWKFGSFLAEQIDIAVKAMTGRGSLGVAIYDMVEGLKKMPKQFAEAGAALIQGLIDGMKAKALEAVNGVKQLGTDMLDGLKSILKIRSPSQAMQDIGEQSAAGYIIGLQSGIQSVGEVAAQLAAATTTNAANSPFNVGAPEDQAAAMAERESAEIGHQQRLLDIRGFFNEQTAANAARYNTLNLQSASVFFQNMGALMQTKSRALFEIGKAGAIGETIINTYLGAQKAFSALAGIPIIGPALGTAAAAAAILAGGARVAAISSTSFGSTSASPVLSSGGVSGPVTSGGAGVVPFDSPNSAAKAAAPERVVNIYLTGEGSPTQSYIRDVLIPGLNDALGDGVTLNVRAA